MRAVSLGVGISLGTTAAQAAVNLLGASDILPPLYNGSPSLNITMTSASPGVASITAPQTAPWLVNGLAVQLYGSVVPTGLAFGTTYYTVAVSGLTFELALTPGGAAINTTGTGTAVTATFQLAGQGAGGAVAYSAGASGPVSCPIASPGVFTGLSLPNGTPVVLTLNPAVAGAVLPTGFTAGTQYFVVATNQQAGTFELSATSGGSAINASAAAAVGVIATALNATVLQSVAGPGSPFLPGYSAVLALGSSAAASTTSAIVEGAEDTMNPPGTPGPYATIASIVGVSTGMLFTEVKKLPQYVRLRVVNGGADAGVCSASLLGV